MRPDWGLRTETRWANTRFVPAHGFAQKIPVVGAILVIALNFYLHERTRVMYRNGPADTLERKPRKNHTGPFDDALAQP